MFMVKIKKVLEELNLTKIEIEKYYECFESVWEFTKPCYVNVDESHNENHIFHVFSRSMKLIFWLKRNYHNWNSKLEKDYIMCMGLASFLHDIYSYTSRKNHHEKAYLLLRKICDIKILEQDNTINLKDKSIIITNNMMEILNSIPNQTTINAVNKFKWLKYYSKLNILEVSNMVKEHRASYKGEFSSMLCELFSTADRDDIDLNIVINRIYTCALNDDNKFECDHNGFQSLTINTKNRSIKILPIIKQLEKDGWDNRLIKTFYHLCEKFSRDGYAYKNLKDDGFYKTYYKDQLEDFWSEIDKIVFIPMSMFKYIRNIKNTYVEK